MKKQNQKEKENAKYNIQNTRKSKLSTPLTEEEKQELIDSLVEVKWESKKGGFFFGISERLQKKVISVVEFINNETELYADFGVDSVIFISRTEMK